MPAPSAKRHSPLARSPPELARHWPACCVNRALARPPCFLRLRSPPQPGPSSGSRLPAPFTCPPLPRLSQRPSRYRESRRAAAAAGGGGSAAGPRAVGLGARGQDGGWLPSPAPSAWPCPRLSSRLGSQPRLCSSVPWGLLLLGLGEVFSPTLPRPGHRLKIGGRARGFHAFYPPKLGSAWPRHRDSPSHHYGVVVRPRRPSDTPTVTGRSRPPFSGPKSAPWRGDRLLYSHCVQNKHRG